AVAHVGHDAVAVAREPRKPIEPVNAAAQQVEPHLIAGRAAERAGGDHQRPEETSGHRVGGDLAVEDLAFDDRGDVDGEVDHADRASTPRTTRATRAACSSVSVE